MAFGGVFIGTFLQLGFWFFFEVLILESWFYLCLLLIIELVLLGNFVCILISFLQFIWMQFIWGFMDIQLFTAYGINFSLYDGS